jgi:translation elongation factor EF-Tu-like GTPase
MGDVTWDRMSLGFSAIMLLTNGNVIGMMQELGAMRSPDIEAEITLLPTTEGGRTLPAFSGYRPQHRIRDDYQTSGTHQYFDCDSLLPGQTVRGTITFITPEVYPHCLWVGRVLDIQEGSRVIGRARITRIMNALLETDAA